MRRYDLAQLVAHASGYPSRLDKRDIAVLERVKNYIDLIEFDPLKLDLEAQEDIKPELQFELLGASGGLADLVPIPIDEDRLLKFEQIEITENLLFEDPCDDPEDFEADIMAWDSIPASKTDALNVLKQQVNLRSIRVDQIEAEPVASAAETYSAEQMQAVIDLVNSLLEKLNAMNEVVFE